jgi:hypothetical protein
VVKALDWAAAHRGQLSDLKFEWRASKRSRETFLRGGLPEEEESVIRKREE